jgi:hypothetical protein
MKQGKNESALRTLARTVERLTDENDRLRRREETAHRTNTRLLEMLAERDALIDEMARKTRAE